MQTISSLRKTLGLSTTNQVRNRIEAIKDVLFDHLRRGPNNQILVADSGVDLLRQLQELYDSGLTMAEASDVMRAKADIKSKKQPAVSSRSAPNQLKPMEDRRLVSALQDEISFLRARVKQMEERLVSHAEGAPSNSPGWWEGLREDLDGS